ncbi:hypothetical protein Dda_3605 [Drechslerella dactyloides]|uniref:Trypsin-like serine protease n=1 Tax=Drechslerella dactyloides TaxID=74499 RepID=A0AAD6IZS9_DREDA|nr:hypothetical protein Dda_3605 [Drechslerella dactyloides]
MEEETTVDYFATHHSKGTLTHPPRGLSALRCDDGGEDVKTPDEKQLAVANPSPSEMFERQKLSRYLDTVFENKMGTCPPVIPIAADFVDVTGKSYCVRATAWAFGTHHLFTCNHTFEDEEIIDSSTGKTVLVQLVGVHWTNSLNPRSRRANLEIVYQDHIHDIAILKSDEAFHRLILQCRPPVPYSKLYTVQILNVGHPIVHPGRAYPSPKPHTFLSDAASTEGFSGGPVMTSNGHVIGMLQASWGDINAMVVTTGGLLKALRDFGGGTIEWEEYGVKACIGWKIPRQLSPPPTAIDSRLVGLLYRKKDNWEQMLKEIEVAKAYEQTGED